MLKVFDVIKANVDVLLVILVATVIGSCTYDYVSIAESTNTSDTTLRGYGTVIMMAVLSAYVWVYFEILDRWKK